MRTFFLSMSLGVLLLGGAGCAYPSASSVPAPGSTNTPSSETHSTDVAFGASATFAIGESRTFQDGIVLQLKAINDSRCPRGVQCIWAGELSPVMVFYDLNKTSQEFTLGTVRATQATVKNYVITLKSATADQVTLTVSKQ